MPLSLLVAHERSSAVLQDLGAVSLTQSFLFPVLESVNKQEQLSDVSHHVKVIQRPNVFKPQLRSYSFFLIIQINHMWEKHGCH